MRRQLSGWSAVVLTVTALTACTSSGGGRVTTPGLAPRGQVMTTVKPTRQDLASKVSLSGKVELGPTFGLVAPVDGEVRYLTVTPPTGTPTRPAKVANVWSGGRATAVKVPAGAVFSGRLVDDRSKVTKGMPIVSAKQAGYGIVADIDGAAAYQISDAMDSVQAQIKNGPGPFPCTVLGTIAALPAGTIPAPPAPSAGASRAPVPLAQSTGGPDPSEATGLRLVCVAPVGTRLINGASATVEVITQRAANVLVLPVEAVAGSQGRGKVDVVRADQTRETRDVVLGLSDGKVVEIKSGLTGDETIAVPGPDLPPGKDGNGGGPAPGMTK